MHLLGGVCGWAPLLPGADVDVLRLRRRQLLLHAGRPGDEVPVKYRPYNVVHGRRRQHRGEGQGVRDRNAGGPLPVSAVM
jgi:hypothetical protein